MPRRERLNLCLVPIYVCKSETVDKIGMRIRLTGLEALNGECLDVHDATGEVSTSPALNAQSPLYHDDYQCKARLSTVWYDENAYRFRVSDGDVHVGTGRAAERDRTRLLVASVTPSHGAPVAAPGRPSTSLAMPTLDVETRSLMYTTH